MALRLELRETQESFRPVHKRPTETPPAVEATHRRRTLRLERSRAQLSHARVRIARELECVDSVLDSLTSILSSFRVIWCYFVDRVCLSPRNDPRNNTKEHEKNSLQPLVTTILSDRL